MTLRTLLLVLSFLAFPLPSIGGDTPKKGAAPPTAFECRFTDEPIKITGKGTDPAWKKAQVIDNFYLPWLGAKARPAKTKTSAKLLWDRENLYFFADMEDADLYADVKEHDGMTWDNDVFELFFKPSDKHAGYYEFQVNAAGTIMDMFLPRRGAGGYKRFIADGKFHIEAKVHLDGTLNNWTDRDKGWSVEGKIPWKDFLRTGGRPEPGEAWKFALCRYDYSVDFEGPELSTCAPLKSLTFPDFHHHEDYATLRFVGPAKKAGLPEALNQRVALTTSKVVGFPDPPPPYHTKRLYPDLKLDFPICVVRQPGTDLLLAVHANRSYGPTKISRFKDDPKVDKSEMLFDLTDTAYDITFHPKFADNGYFYVGSNGATGPKEPKKTRVTRYTMERTPPYRVDPKSKTVIIEWDSDGHNGAAIAFGLDGMLYVTAGDGTSDSDTNLVGQDMSKLLAKVLRIDVDHPDKSEPGDRPDKSKPDGSSPLSPSDRGRGAGGEGVPSKDATPRRNYGIPKDNPFVGVKGARPEIWAIGVRNPWRMTVDAKTGHLWVGQNGQDLWEQAYFVKKGENYGWSVTEGSHDFYPHRTKGPNFFTKPTIEHHHSEFRSLTGGIVYYGKKYPELQGAYLYGDYSTGRIWGMKHDGTKPLWHKELAQTRLAITGFGVDKDGEILVCDFQGDGKGAFYTLEPTPDPGPSTFPRTLSASGLFESVKGHVMKPAMMPYSVNAMLWSDGVNKVRWLGIPDKAKDAKIDFPGSRGWNLPDETVIVKSFFIEDEEGNPATKRWIETRFLTRQGGEWYGYTYAWNDDQSEATLLDAKGTDRVFNIKVKPSKENPEGKKALNWHYPSRAECMVCHSRAANWVLGLNEMQFNHVQEHSGVKENQLASLERLGLLKVNYYEQAKEMLREEAKAKGLTEKQIETYVNDMCKTRDQRPPVTSSSLLTKSPEKYRRLVNPRDEKADLTARVRSYLHANCSICHVEAGGGNAMIDLEFLTPPEKMRIINVPPQHNTFGIKDAKLIYPGHPEKSVLLHRIAHRTEGFMPPLATRVVDAATVRMLEAWIRSLP